MEETVLRQEARVLHALISSGIEGVAAKHVAVLIENNHGARPSDISKVRMDNCCHHCC